MIVASIAILAGVSATSAQEQEGKLVDRILKPNMSLVNSAQNKQFGAAGAYATRSAPSKSFYTTKRSLGKSFAANRTFSSRQLAEQRFSAGNDAANISTRSQPTSQTVSVVSVADGARVAPENRHRLDAVPFPGSRPFLGQGKSQKALRARDTPLTIEQVRELLNKSK
jgi:type II secretory pathway component GspD/PulD (secretin)